MKKSSGGYLHKGLSTNNPRGVNGDGKGTIKDKPSESVDSRAVRSGTAPTPRSLPGRTA
jgi:hypothetical protein